MPTLHWIGKDKVINHHMDVPFKVLDKIYDFGMTIDENGNPAQENVCADLGVTNEDLRFTSDDLGMTNDDLRLEVGEIVNLKSKIVNQEIANRKSGNMIIHGDNLEALKAPFARIRRKDKMYLHRPALQHRQRRLGI
jgi:hypothetical protein